MKQIFKLLSAKYILFILLTFTVTIPAYGDYSYDMALKARENLKQRNFSKAVYYLEEAAKDGSSKIWAKRELGRIYFNGYGVTKNYSKAKQYYEEASDGGNIDAKANLGYMYLYGEGVTKNYSKAKQYLEEASHGGEIYAKNNLGHMYLHGYGVAKNYSKAKQYIEEASDGGHIVAKRELGRIYFNGYGVTKNYSKAKQYLEEASYGGDIDAKNILGYMYLNGYGVTKNYSKAKQYLEEVKSYNTLGWMYYTEEPIRNYKKAKMYFEKGIDSGGISEKNNLALMYFRGQGVAKNYKKAKELFEEVANADFADPKNNLAWMYFNGYGVKQDIDKALNLFKEAAEKDNLAANLNLAWIYKNGINVKVDNNKVNYWQDRANSLGEESSQENYELTYTFDAPSINDNIATLLKKSKQKKISNKRYLIVIGAENYEYTDNIIYSQHSAQMFRKVAQKTLGISKTNTLELTNKSASMGKIQMKIKKLLRRVKNGDTVYFYYSGHGIPVTSQKNEPYILPIDVEPEYISEAPFFKLKNVYKILGDSKASKVVVFIDSCFSGATDGVSIIKGVAATRLQPKKVIFDQKKMIVITAGKDKQYSNMYEDKGYRLFSYYLMESMLKGRTSVKDIYNELYLNVKDKSYEMGDMKLQEPTISGNKDMKL